MVYLYVGLTQHDHEKGLSIVAILGITATTAIIVVILIVFVVRLIRSKVKAMSRNVHLQQGGDLVVPMVSSICIGRAISYQGDYIYLQVLTTPQLSTHHAM